MRKIALLLLIGFLSFGVKAQVPFSDLTAIQFGDSIILDWTLDGGSTCFDMFLQRSEDGVNYENIFSVSGVCGGAIDQYYNHIDSEGLNSGITYSYRVSASGGAYISKEASILFISSGDVDVFVYPNPVSSQINITIDNKYHPRFLVELYNGEGKLIIKSLQYNNLFTLNVEPLASDGYVLKITTEDGMYFGQKIIVQ